MNTDTLYQFLEVVLKSPFGIGIAWGAPQLILLILTTTAALRHNLVGLWFLVIAAILLLINKIVFAAVVTFTHANARELASLECYPSFFITLILIVGWGILAFCKPRGPDPMPNTS
jgi:hypothetical protein